MKFILDKLGTTFSLYFLICILCFLLDSGFLLLLVYTFHISIDLAEIVGLLIGNTSNYILSTRYAFHNPKYQNKVVEYLYYVFLGMLSYPLHHIVFKYSNSIIGIEYLALSKIVAVGLSFIFTYILRKYLLFSDPPPQL